VGSSGFQLKVPSDYEVAAIPELPSGLPSMKVPTTKEEAEKMKDIQEQQP
jgi:hypothetical protein